MDIRLEQHTIREVAEGYIDNAESGVLGYNGKLNIRPAYQREFVYDEKKRNAVIDTVMKGFPLNVMYWCENADGTYELLDGQQRTISICQYVNGDFSVNHKGFSNLTDTEQKQFLDYKLMIYVCSGNDKEKLDWFRIINIAGEQLLPQELRNAVYTGSWLSDAKRYFSKTGCAAYTIGSKLVSGNVIRQDYLQAAIEWIAAVENKCIEDYMAEHQHDTNASQLWIYFQNVVNWVNTIFPVYRKEMKGLKWGLLYNRYHTAALDPTALETRIEELMQDDDVTAKKGIYEYLLSGDERHLNIRAFSDSQKRIAYEKQSGICTICKHHFDYEEMEGDHINPWKDGGKTELDNLQMLCKPCNRRKSSK